MADGQSAPGTKAPLYDIGRFLSGGLNMTPEEARTFIERQRQFARFGALERDQGGVTTVEVDTYLDLLEMADRLVSMWEDDTHRSVVNAYHGTWAVEHSLRCRATGDMAGCIYMDLMTQADKDGHLPPDGRWALRILETDDGPMLLSEDHP